MWQRIAEQFNLISGTLKSLLGDPDSNAWERSITHFETQDKQNPPAENAIVFTGSSSITLWKTLIQDMAPLPVINRGFGGAKINDVVRYVDRIVLPYRPQAVVLFAGTNDISWPKPGTALDVLQGFQAFVDAIHVTLPQTPIYYISITPTPSRWKYWPIADD